MLEISNFVWDVEEKGYGNILILKPSLPISLWTEELK